MLLGQEVTLCFIPEMGPTGHLCCGPLCAAVIWVWMSLQANVFEHLVPGWWFCLEGYGAFGRWGLAGERRSLRLGLWRLACFDSSLSSLFPVHTIWTSHLKRLPPWMELTLMACLPCWDRLKYLWNHVPKQTCFCWVFAYNVINVMNIHVYFLIPYFILLNMIFLKYDIFINSLRISHMGTMRFNHIHSYSPTYSQLHILFLKNK